MRALVISFAAALAFAAAGVSTSQVWAEDGHSAPSVVEIGSLKITDAWTKAMLPGQPVGGGFLSIENTGAAADKLLSVSSEVSPDVQIHEMKMEGDVMKMRELEEGLEIPARAKVELTPGGLHLMFMEMKEPFKEGSEIKVKLNFEKAGEVEVMLPVGPANAATHGG